MTLNADFRRSPRSPRLAASGGVGLDGDVRVPRLLHSHQYHHGENDNDDRPDDAGYHGEGYRVRHGLNPHTEALPAELSRRRGQSVQEPCRIAGRPLQVERNGVYHYDLESLDEFLPRIWLSRSEHRVRLTKVVADDDRAALEPFA